MNEDREWLGGGLEKDVYEDSIDPQGKVLEYIGASLANETGCETVNQTKSRYFLQKILHLLLPQEIPDIHFAGGRFLRAERREVDEIHTAIQNFIHLTPRDMPMEEYMRANTEFGQNSANVMNHPKVQKLKNRLGEVGLIGSFDIEKSTARNFAFDTNGNAQFLDNNSAWDIDKDGQMTPNVDFDKLKIAIEGLKEPEKTQALKFFNRLRSLYDNEQNNKKIN